MALLDPPVRGVGDVSVPSILTSIVATIGPASDSPEMVRRLIQNGVSVFRFNFSHGDFAGHERRLRVVREVAAELGTSIGCLGDLQGPKIRVGKIPAGVGEPHPSGGGSIRVGCGQDVILKRGIAEAFMRQGPQGEEAVLPLTYQEIVGEVQLGHRVLINDGAIRMLAVDLDRSAGELRCRVTVGGLISSGKGINVPQSTLSAPAVTDRDWECVLWAVRHHLDFLALSFVRKAEDVIGLRDRIAELRSFDAAGRETDERAWMPLVAKVETPQALTNIAQIVEACDAVMVARGDLGVEMDISRVPVAQKEIAAECARQGRPCIVATQMLETMIDNASPTRAEASDVANAIFDGCDAVMLSAETATGKHPALVVETMARIIGAAEARMKSQPQRREPPTYLVANHRGTAALAHGAWEIAEDLNAVCVVCWSENGGTARYLSQNRFAAPIIAYSSNEQACRRMSLLRGVTAVCAQPPGSGTLSEWNAHVDAWLIDKRVARPGDPILLLAGRPLGQAKKTNTIAIHKVGEPTGYGAHGR